MKNGLLKGVILSLALCGTVGCSTTYATTTNTYESYNNAEAYKASSEFNYDGTDIKNVYIHWLNGTIKAYSGASQKSLSVTENSSSLQDNEKMHYLIEGDSLYIYFCESGLVDNINENYKVLTIEIPTNANLTISDIASTTLLVETEVDKLSYTSISGSLTIQSIKANTMNLSDTSGEILLFFIEAKKLVSSTVSGKMTLLYASVDNIDLDSTSGSISLSLSKASTLDIDSVSSDVSISREGVGLSVTYETVSGSFNALDYTINGDKKIFGDGACITSVTTVSGNLIIK